MIYSGQTVKIDNKNAFQVNIIRAKRLFNAGRTIYLHPCNMIVDNVWQNPIPIKKQEGLRFESVVNNFSYYNCDNERGNRVLFFVQVKNR